MSQYRFKTKQPPSGATTNCVNPPQSRNGIPLLRSCSEVRRRRFFLQLSGVVAFALVASFCGRSPLYGSTFYVNAQSGNDSSSGKSNTEQWKTIQKACEEVQPGDTVLVEPGVYFEHVQLSRAGTAALPITFRATDYSKNAVIITGADAKIRTKEVRWEKVDADLYSVAMDHEPVRLLYDDVDLFPYRSLQELKEFRLKEVTPGPKHGFYYDPSLNKLYVRLYPGGKYGSPDPNEHVMKVAPVKGVSAAARFVNQPSGYNFGILIEHKPANVVIEGFTFETPGVDGIYSHAGNFTVRDCWFLGCRWAVSGKIDSWEDAQRVNDVVVEYCDYGHFPTFDDTLEIVDEVKKLTPAEKSHLPNFYWWERKEFVDNTYECGLIARVGDRWQVRHNYIHDTVDGISSWGCDLSRDCDISENVFERLIDNAVEGENHNLKMKVHGNYVLDVFEPFSWQPLGGIPWPTMWVYQNVVKDTSKGVSLFDALPHERGCFKIMAQSQNWTAKGMENVSKTQIVIPDPGFFAYNNTINLDGVLFTLGSPSQTFSNLRFVNNSISTRDIVAHDASLLGTLNFTMAGNAVSFSKSRDPKSASFAAGSKGTPLQGKGSSLNSDPVAVLTSAGSPRKGLPSIKGGVDFSPQIGALNGSQKYQVPSSGPRISRQETGTSRT